MAGTYKWLVVGGMICVLTGCVMSPFRLKGQVFLVQKGLSIGVVPMWVPDQLKTSHGYRLFDDWLYRRQRIYDLMQIFHRQPMDLVIWTHLLSQSDGGVESEPEILSFDQKRPEVWQTIEVGRMDRETHNHDTNKQSHQPDSKWIRRYQVYSSFMSRPSENFLEDTDHQMAVIWREPHISSSQSPSWMYEGESYVLVSGFIYNQHPLLVVLVHRPFSDSHSSTQPSQHQQIVESIQAFIASSTLCANRLIIIASVGQSDEFNELGLEKHSSSQSGSLAVFVAKETDIHIHRDWLSSYQSAPVWVASDSSDAALLFQQAIKIQITSLLECVPDTRSPSTSSADE